VSGPIDEQMIVDCCLFSASYLYSKWLSAIVCWVHRPFDDEMATPMTSTSRSIREGELPELTELFDTFGGDDSTMIADEDTGEWFVNEAAVRASLATTPQQGRALLHDRGVLRTPDRATSGTVHQAHLKALLHQAQQSAATSSAKKPPTVAKRGTSSSSTTSSSSNGSRSVSSSSTLASTASSASAREVANLQRQLALSQSMLSNGIASRLPDGGARIRAKIEQLESAISYMTKIHEEDDIAAINNAMAAVKIASTAALASHNTAVVAAKVKSKFKTSGGSNSGSGRPAKAAATTVRDATAKAAATSTPSVTSLGTFAPFAHPTPIGGPSLSTSGAPSTTPSGGGSSGDAPPPTAASKVIPMAAAFTPRGELMSREELDYKLHKLSQGFTSFLFFVRLYAEVI
jgi:hypothetical protein